MTNLELLEKRLGIKFKNPVLLKKALIHRSYLNETSEEVDESNERLEFLGDAVLQFLSSEFLYKNYPLLGEGDLTNIRSKVVNTESLAYESSRFEIGEFILISRGEKETAKESHSILANVFEAILGALYLDQGIEASRSYLNANLFYKVEDVVKSGSLKDSKSLYQEIAQEKYLVTPQYKIITEEGPDHNKIFISAVYINNKEIARGSGSSKRKSEQEAAQNALNLLNEEGKVE
jgi:ribonuclease-3